MDREGARLLGELQEYKRTHPAPVVADPLLRILDDDPPRLHSYPAMGTIAAMQTAVGILLLALAVLGLIVVTAAAGITAYGTGPIGDALATAEASSRGTLAAASIVAALTGFGFIAGAEQTRLFIDLQQNADRQAMILQLIYRTFVSLSHTQGQGINQLEGRNDSPNQA